MSGTSCRRQAGQAFASPKIQGFGYFVEFRVQLGLEMSVRESEMSWCPMLQAQWKVVCMCDAGAFKLYEVVHFSDTVAQPCVHTACKQKYVWQSHDKTLVLAILRQVQLPDPKP